jgi:hypothetical protein
MKTINLYFDFEFTSLSPDAQPISLGIVSDEKKSGVPCFVARRILDARRLAKKYGYYHLDSNCCVASKPEHLRSYNMTEIFIEGDISDKMKKAISLAKKTQIVKPLQSKSFYSEFSDFDINRCGDWVKDNVVSKLKMYGKNEDDIIENTDNNNYQVLSITRGVKIHLKEWLKQFSDYQIQFIADCATYDWYWMVQLLAIWDVIGIQSKADMGFVPTFKTGLPTLPINISPVPFDLNDLIAIKKRITPGEAFEVDRFELLGSWDKLEEIGETGKVFNTDQFPKHNALFDAKVIKEIYNKLL